MMDDRGVPAGNLHGGARIDGAIPGPSPGDPGSLVLDGVDDYASLSVTGLPGIDRNKTVSFWYHLAALPRGRQFMVVFVSSTSNAALEFLLQDAQPIVYVAGTGLGDLGTTARSRVGWNHLAYTYDTNGTVNAGYLNGAPTFTVRAAPRAGAVSQLLLGTVDPGDPDNFAGRIDDLRIYNRPLSPAEITALYRGAP